MIGGAGIHRHAAGAAAPHVVYRLAQEGETHAGADGVGHQPKIGQIDVGPGAPVEFEKSGWLASTVEHMDGDGGIAQKQSHVTVGHGSPEPPDIILPHGIVQISVEGYRAARRLHYLVRDGQRNGRLGGRMIHPQESDCDRDAFRRFHHSYC